MANRYEWLVENADKDLRGRVDWTEDRHPSAAEDQATVIIAALGDWIEALLEARAAMSAEGVDVAAAARIAEEKGKDAKRRAIEAGYVWRLDLDPT